MDRIILFFIITLFYVFLSKMKFVHTNNRIVFIVSSSIVLILASALRSLSVGPDTYQYYTIFEAVKDVSFNDIWQSIVSKGVITKDPFYWLFQKGFQLFSGNYNAYLGLVALLFFTSLGIFIYQNGLSLVELYVSYVFYLGLFYGFYSITGIRQTIAVSFILCAYLCLMDNKTIAFLVFTFVGYLFHASAIVFAISFLLIRIRNVKVLLYGVVAVIPILFVYRNIIFTLLVSFFGLEERFMQYMDDDYGGSISVLLLYLSVVAGILLKFKSFSHDPKKMNHIKIFSVCILGLPLLFVSGTGLRITQYFSVSMFVLVPYLVSSLKINAKYLFAVLLMFLLIVVAYRNAHYAFYWEEPVGMYIYH